MKSEQKLTINKLIANDIINYALDDAVCDNYVMGINEYLKDFDEDSKKYINENIDTILDDIEQSECVLDLEIDRSNNDIELDFIFAWGKLLNQVEQIVLDNSKLFISIMPSCFSSSTNSNISFACLSKNNSVSL